jgi:CRISPR-associated protein Cas2
MIWGQFCAYIEDGNAVIAWSAPNDAGFQFETCGKNRRVPVDVDGLRLVACRSVGRPPFRKGCCHPNRCAGGVDSLAWNRRSDR